MADPLTYRPKSGEVPTNPGVYRFLDEHGRVIYVGKAKNLRSRLANYFQDLAGLHPRTAHMVTTAAAVEWTVVGTEVEALALEYTWIKQFDPRFNVKYRDDKSYPYLTVTMGEQFPRALVMRGEKKPGNVYFGPYGHAWAIRDTLDHLLRVFPMRTCSKGVFLRAQRSGSPCLLAHIGKCAAPCVERVSEAEHREIANDLVAFLSGKTGRYVRDLTTAMHAAAAELDFERAAQLRDDIAALERVMEQNAVVLDDATDADIFALAGDELEGAIQVFHVRRGRIRGQRGWIVEKAEELADSDLIEQLLMQVYGEAEDSQTVPKEILVPTLPSNLSQLETWLYGKRGSKVSIRVPKRGDKRTLAQTVLTNAEQAFNLHRSRRASDLTTRSLALEEIQQALGMLQAPLRIECFDVSHTQGTYQSASMVVFEDGLPRKSEYRTFNIQGINGQGARDDTEAIYEALTRRFKHPANAGQDQPDAAAPPPQTPQTGEVKESDPRPRRFAYPPQLIVVDGGQPQVNAAARALADCGVLDVTLCGLAKRLEEVWLPAEPYPLILGRTSEGLYLLQRLRDEAHRFAIRAHRNRRSKGMTRSKLDSIPGVGPAKQASLLKAFGSVRAIAAADPAELAAVSGIGPKLAEVIKTKLDGETSPVEAQTGQKGDMLEE